eukprot:ANDGO_00837.mRNA.1 Phosphoglycerate mutase-like protein
MMFLESEKVKTVYFFRHAEATHNAASKASAADHGTASRLSAFLDPAHIDARLTETGIAQATNARSVFWQKFGIAPHADSDIQLVCTSTLARTVQTASLLFPPHEYPNYVCLEMLREQAGKHLCDRRRPIRQIRTEFAFARFPDFPDDLEFDDEDDMGNQAERESRTQVEKRCRQLVEFLSKRPESVIAVVSHAAYLRHFFGLLGLPSTRIQMANCECRKFVFLDPADAHCMASELDVPHVARNILTESSVTASHVFGISYLVVSEADFQERKKEDAVWAQLVDANSPIFAVAAMDAEGRLIGEQFLAAFRENGKAEDALQCVRRFRRLSEGGDVYEIQEKQRVHRRAVLLIATCSVQDMEPVVEEAKGVQQSILQAGADSCEVLVVIHGSSSSNRRASASADSESLGLDADEEESVGYRTGKGSLHAYSLRLSFPSVDFRVAAERNFHQHGLTWKRNSPSTGSVPAKEWHIVEAKMKDSLLSGTGTCCISKLEVECFAIRNLPVANMSVVDNWKADDAADACGSSDKAADVHWRFEPQSNMGPVFLLWRSRSEIQTYSRLGLLPQFEAIVRFYAQYSPALQQF